MKIPTEGHFRYAETHISNNGYYNSHTLVLGYLAGGKIFENMLQLMRFSVYFERLLNWNNGY